MARNDGLPGRSSKGGFTLIELLVTIAIVGIIAAVAVPMFGEQLAKSRRAEAITVLADLQLRQERWRANHSTYGTLADVGGATFNNGYEHYTFSVSSNDATDVLLTATPEGAQVGDRCGNFLLRIDGNNNNTPDGNVDKTTSTGEDRCW